MPQEPYPLTNAHWKAERAKCHLDDMMVMERDFCADSHTITSEPEPERDQTRHRVYLKQPHVSLYLVCGDYLQCLRTALDQAVWSLINQRTGRDADYSEFPVFSDPLNAKTRPQFSRKTEGLSTSAISYIEALQPYNRPAGMPLVSNPLWCLHELNRIDKHRRISVQSQVALTHREYFGMSVPRADFAEVSRETTDYGFDFVCRGTYKDLKPKVTTVVIFGEPERGIAMDIGEIAQLYCFVADEVLVALASCSQ